jgi:hypothetical protein
MSRIVNLTPHAIVVFIEDAKTTTYPSEGVIRAKTTQMPMGNVPNTEIPLVSMPVITGIDNEDLLLKHSNDDIIVSTLAAEAISKFTTFSNTIYVPDSGPLSAVRTDEGQIVGVRRLMVFRKAL